ncbi:MAG: type I-E CRISPR-associated protein Cas6/Cse3/CasE [Micrococcales bacterium]|nr:type I-E CRISPR-associated protein Cas6/Cse3/CasE [Micrococcales bacterium]
MFLTQMHLNPARRGTRHLLASPQRLHAAVLHGFPPGSTLGGPAGRVLWRVDQAQASITLYVSSPAEPDLTHIVEQAGWPTAPQHWRTVSTAQMHDRLAAGQEWVFRLTANPVRNERVPGERGKRHGHVTVSQQEDWLGSRSETWGFSLVTAEVTGRRHVTFSRRGPDTAGSVTLSMATFDGVLQVTDPDALRRSLTSGVGRAKGYGCGLITLAPVR